MSTDYWKKQADEPLFADILWSRPESKATSGKLAIVGGDANGFAAPGIAYNVALESGVGVCRVVLPDAIKKVVKGVLPDANFAPSTPSGSFGKTAIDELLSSANWSDGTLLAGDIGRNSETAVLLEKFAERYSGLLTIAHDAVDYFKETPQQIIDRPDTLIVLSLSQLQKLFIATPSMTAITTSMTTPQLAHALHDYTQVHAAGFIVLHNDLLFVAHNGQVTTTRCDKKIWRVETAARASVFWLQNPRKLLEAVSTSVVEAA